MHVGIRLAVLCGDSHKSAGLPSNCVNTISYYVSTEENRALKSVFGKGGKQMEIVQSILTENSCYKAGKKIAVQGLMLHSVGCSQPMAMKFIEQWNKETAGKKCVHAFIDGNTGLVYQTLPWDHRGWHCGGAANDTHIGVEMCEPSSIRYGEGAAFECVDRNDALTVVRRTYNAAVELFAFLCREYGLDPLADGVIISHREGHVRGVASGHQDPTHLWNGLQSGYTMDGFRHDVKLAMHQEPDPDKPPRMDISENGVKFIMKFEGCRLKAYQSAGGTWTIGYGHTHGVTPNDTLPSQEAATALLYEDLKEYTGYVNTYREMGVIGFSLNQNQFDALTSFCYNRGSGTLRELVTERSAVAVADGMLSYILVNGEINKGLQRRREEERAMFLS